MVQDHTGLDEGGENLLLPCNGLDSLMSYSGLKKHPNKSFPRIILKSLYFNADMYANLISYAICCKMYKKEWRDES